MRCFRHHISRHNSINVFAAIKLYYNQSSVFAVLQSMTSINGRSRSRSNSSSDSQQQPTPVDDNDRPEINGIAQHNNNGDCADDVTISLPPSSSSRDQQQQQQLDNHIAASRTGWKERENELEMQLSMADQEIAGLRRHLNELGRENDDLMKAVAYLKTKLESSATGRRAPTPAGADPRARQQHAVCGGPRPASDQQQTRDASTNDDVVSDDVNSAAHSADSSSSSSVDVIPNCGSKSASVRDQSSATVNDDDPLGVSTAVGNGKTSVDKCRLTALEDDNS